MTVFTYTISGCTPLDGAKVSIDTHLRVAATAILVHTGPGQLSMSFDSHTGVPPIVLSSALRQLADQLDLQSTIPSAGQELS